MSILDSVSAMRNTETETDVSQLRFKFITRCADPIPNYWKRCMPPHQTKLVMETTVDPKLRAAMAAIAVAVGASPAVLGDRWYWEQEQLPLSMGGLGIG